MQQRSPFVCPDLFEDQVEGAMIKVVLGWLIAQGHTPRVHHKGPLGALKESLKVSYGLSEDLTGLGFGGFPPFYCVASLDFQTVRASGEHPHAERTASLSDCLEVLESNRVGRLFSSINILFTPTF